MRAAEFLKRLPDAFDADVAGDVACTVQFAISEPAHAVIGDGSCRMQDGDAVDPDVTLTMDDDDLMALLRGELNGMTAFMTGRLQIDGDLMLAQRLFTFFDASRLN